MLITTSILMDNYKNYSNIAAKIKRLVIDGTLIPIVKGLYETEKSTPGYYLASAIYGPSYLSFEYALSYHSLIPEAVYTYTCATFRKKKEKLYKTPFGTFKYRDIPDEAYPYGVEYKIESGYSVLIASPEKALCDLLYTISPCHNIAEFKNLLFEDLRIDEEEFYRLNMSDLKELAGYYHTKNHKLLQSLIRRKI